jgi:phosphonate transport system permease protein
MNPIPDPTIKKPNSTQSVLNGILTYLFMAIFIGVVVWSFAGLAPDLAHIRNGMDGIKDYVGQMIPQTKPDWSYDIRPHTTLLAALYATIQMAVVGTVVGAILAFPASFFAARTGIIPRLLSGAIKSVFNVGRSIPTIIVALIVVGGIGLGDAAGAVTLALVTFVTLTKLFAEALETVNPGPIEAVKAVGGDSASVFVYGMMPQVFPVYVSTTLYSLEINLQSSFIIGIVGAGGLGYELINDIHYYDLRDVGLIVFIMIVAVNLVDYISYRLRRVFA